MSKVSKKSDAKKVVAGLADFWRVYSAETSERVKLIDWFILFLVTLMGLQFFYRLVVGDDFPKNAFLTGMFCPLGIVVLLVNIRSEKKDYRQLAEFFLAALVLFLVSINFLG